MEARGLIGPEDTSLYLITDDVTEAVAEILGFYRNYHSLRWVGDRLVIRLQTRPTDGEVAALCEEFAGMCLRGGIRCSRGRCPQRYARATTSTSSASLCASTGSRSPLAPADRRSQCPPERSPAAGRPPCPTQPASPGLSRSASRLSPDAGRALGVRRSSFYARLGAGPALLVGTAASTVSATSARPAS